MEFGVVIGEYEGVVRVPRRVFQRLSPTRPRAAEDGAVLYFESIPHNELLKSVARRVADGSVRG